ncbi:MAG: flagellar basal body P-ring formation protein FlgA [Candidatus Eremiobacteraeota bacterium]|nr:flagellar basal body P-ring formation protein FlgA [Candidatus Eremiobacteraeota bacterium]
MRFLLVLTALLVTGTFSAPVPARAQTSDGTQRISGKTFESMGNGAIAKLSFPGDAKLVPAGSIRDQVVAAGKVGLTLESPLVTPSYVNVPIDISVNGSFLRTVFVGYRLQQYVKTAVAAHDLVAGTVIVRDDVSVERVAFSGRQPNGTEVLIGRKIVFPFRKGQPIYVEETQTDQIVKPGSSVVLIVNDGGVSIVAEAIARTGGGLGDEVNVYNPSTNKMLSGTVVGPDRVELDILGVQQ